MNFFKFQYFAVLFAITLLLHGCVIVPRDDRSDYLSKQSLSTTSSESAIYDATVNVSYHIVQRGETLYGISRHYGLNYHDVAAWNNIYPPYTIWPGQQLLIHTAYTLPVVNAFSVDQYPTVVPANYHAGITPLSYRNSTVVPLNYTSRRIVPLSYRHSTDMPLNYRDTYIIPLNYRTSTTLPVYYNYNTPSVAPIVQTEEKSALSVVPVTTIPVTTSIPESNFHTVRNGESLSSIASLYGLTTYELALWNDITSPYTVYAGQKLLIVEP